jgi:alanine dehydrogenase
MASILLTHKDIAELLTVAECIEAVENAFRWHAQGKMAAPGILGMHVENGGFHIKAGISGQYFVTKINANFPLNATLHGLPTIQGIIAVFDAANGKLLALLDSIEITIIRTGAATAVAAKYLANPAATTATICGCGNQGKISVKALRAVRQLTKIYAFDLNETQARQFVHEFKDLEVIPILQKDLRSALQQSQICITCTPSKQPFIHEGDIAPGLFIGAVGADNEEKQELSVEVLCRSKMVVDLLEQASKIGELHHAISQGRLTASDVHAEIGDIIAGKKAGRESPHEIIVFDSTGTALQDAVTAAIAYEKAVTAGMGKKLDFSALD